MNLIRCLHITNANEAIQQMKKVGVDPTGVKLMEGKTLHFNLKVEGIEPRTANLLKQELLSLGGDVAVDGRGFDCSANQTDALLMGTQKNFEKLILKLEQYPDLQPLGQSIKETLKNISKTHYSIRCRKRTLILGKRTLLMGVLNVTPDSFSDDGFFFDKEKAIAHGLRMVEEGADIIDIGGESTRPGSKPLELEEELRRVIPVIESLAKEVDVPISIDTYKSTVAQRAIEAGAEMINDISGLHFDPGLAQVAAKEDAPLVLMHIRGTPETMQKDVHYDSLFSEILQYLKDSIQRAESTGLDPRQIIIDPGIGFGKTVEDNLLIIKNLYEFRILGKPILLGTSRKTFIGKILNTEVGDRLEGTLSSIAIGVLNGAHIIRSHDVLQAKKAIAVADAIRLAG
ncbi:MAG: dihydropteroate synthase [Desulfobacterales bacterium]|jgi:dihydropteroate synthase|nr:dihydropteroate synthase [Desulfobacterales bacterium]